MFFLLFILTLCRLKMKCLILWIFLVETVSGLTVLEALLRSVSGQPVLKELKDFPRCGRPSEILDTSGRRPVTRRNQFPGQNAFGQPTRSDTVRYGSAPAYIYGYQCSVSNKCSYGCGDCDSNDECVYPYVCGNNNCQNQEFAGITHSVGGSIIVHSSNADCCTLRAQEPTEATIPTPDPLTNSNNQIMSTNYPEEYENDEKKEWIVRTNGNYQWITVTIIYVYEFGIYTRMRL